MSGWTPPPAPPPKWTATHTIPEGGLAARKTANMNAPQLLCIKSGVQVRVAERNVAWALIVTEEGWMAWVDGRRLVEIDGA